MAKKLRELDFVKDIDSLCELDKYTLNICKERDDESGFCVYNYDESDFCVYDYNPNFNKEHEKSASYYGEKDYHLVYSNYSYCLCDYLDSMISNIENNYKVIQNIRKTMENLAKSGKFKDIELMSPHARSLDSDNLVFIIGFNDV